MRLQIATWCLAFAAVEASVAQVPVLEQPCPIEWRGQSLKEALDQLSTRLGVPWIRDQAVSDQRLEARVRFYAAHLNGRQAFRWTARLAGLDAVLTSHLRGNRPVILVAEASRLPRSWMASGSAGGLSASPEQAARWSGLQARRADVEWIDLPMTQVGREMATLFGVDLAVSPDITDQVDMVHIELGQATVGDVLTELGRQLKGSARFEDGLVWLSSGAASRPAGAKEETPPTLTGARWPLVEVAIRNPASFSDLSRQIQAGGGLKCRIKAAANQVPPELQACGALADVLEALRLIEGWAWRHQQTDNRDGGEVLISVPAPSGGQG